MLSELRRRYPLRLDLPSESEIRQCISYLTQKQKKGQSTSYITRSSISEPYLDTINAIFDENKTIAPKVAWQLFQERHPLTDPFPESYPVEKKVKNKISSLKAQHKRRCTNNDLCKYYFFLQSCSLLYNHYCNVEPNVPK